MCMLHIQNFTTKWFKLNVPVSSAGYGGPYDSHFLSFSSSHSLFCSLLFSSFILFNMYCGNVCKAHQYISKMNIHTVEWCVVIKEIRKHVYVRTHTHTHMNYILNVMECTCVKWSEVKCSERTSVQYRQLTTIIIINETTQVK